ncbi:hypothetical protein IOCL2690_000522200 [Leishmania lindenbergi]|uniref:Uncharacterized protein n=1 Tax=Leishmania lindenbergi TaxID=651832 RepID=A0AAW3AAR6_9TRYP
MNPSISRRHLLLGGAAVMGRGNCDLKDRCRVRRMELCCVVRQAPLLLLPPLTRDLLGDGAVAALSSTPEGELHFLLAPALVFSSIPSLSTAVTPSSGSSHHGEGFGDEVDGEGWRVPHAEGVVYELLDVASHEFDVKRQHRFLAATFFAGEAIHLRSRACNATVSVVRQLRVLRALCRARGAASPHSSHHRAGILAANG